MTSGRFHSTKLLRSKSSLIVMAHFFGAMTRGNKEKWDSDWA